MMTDDEIIAVVQARKEGKAIQIRRFVSGRSWLDGTPSWNFEEFEYRVKPEPLVRWVVKYDDGSISRTLKKEMDAKDLAQSTRGVVVKMVEADDQQ